MDHVKGCVCVRVCVCKSGLELEVNMLGGEVK